jgi:hypothetical protein
MIGKVLKRTSTRAYANRMAEVEQLLGTPSAAEAARIAPFFGFTIGRDLELPNACGMDLERTLMLSHEMRWKRPFVPDEDVNVTVTLTEIIDKPDREIAIVETLFETPAKEEIQRQYSTFVEFKSSRL